MSENDTLQTDSSRYDIECVIRAEKERIAQHRKNRDVLETSPYTGLSLSGGGIRSASFALGVLQGLDKFDLLKKFDYLSTVSGGGYIGSSLTWFNYLKAKADETWTFPFGTSGYGTRTSQTPLNYLRQHCDFLNPTPQLNGVAAFANFFRNSLLSFCVYFSLFVCLFYVLFKFDLFDPSKNILWDAPLIFDKIIYSILPKTMWNTALEFAAVLIVIFILITALYSVMSYVLNGMSKRDYYWRILIQKLLGKLVTVFVISVALGTLPLVDMLLSDLLLDAAGGMISVLGGLGSFYTFRQQQAAKKKVNGGPSLLAMLAPVVLTYGLALLTYAAAKYLVENDSFSSHDVTIFVFLPSLILGVLVNTNHFGPGRFYRDRLMEAFMPGDETVKDNKWRPAFDADAAKLSDMCGVEEPGPYHIINCNLILADSEDARFRGRGGDSFILSPLFCGGFAIGWFKTKRFIKNSMTLATAMSISGAALSPNAANNGSGATRNRVLSFLLSVLNLRLGYYATNPSLTGTRRWLTKFSQPNFYFPGFKQGILGGGLNEKANYLSLSDGGHFENCGLYELARRKLDVIMVCEAGADEDYTLVDLANAIERIRVDFGYHIDFPAEFGIDELIPGSGGTIIGNLDIKLAQRGFAIGDIYYDNGTSGKIIYLQAVLVDRLPPDIFAYRKMNHSFPNEPTTDQFFDEAQLEAYRELGYQLCKDMALKNTDKRWI